MMSLIKYSIEYPIKTSISILYKRLTTPSGLSEWFADNVNIKNDVLTFYWDGSEEDAIILKMKKHEFIRFQWVDDEGEEKYFEFFIQVHNMTKDISLIVTDFAEDEQEKEDGIQLWDKQIDNLKNAIGI
ncbi:MAG: START-like domain-containing protein [Flavobacteriales bacterium]